MERRAHSPSFIPHLSFTILSILLLETYELYFSPFPLIFSVMTAFAVSFTSNIPLDGVIRLTFSLKLFKKAAPFPSTPLLITRIKFRGTKHTDLDDNQDEVKLAALRFGM